MLQWEGQHGGEQHHARHHTNTSAASAARAGNRGWQHWRDLLAVSCGVGTGVPATALPAPQSREPPLNHKGGEQE